MPYQALARQYRPQRFDAVVGQDYTVRAFQNAITQQRVHHAYLLTGTRGVGKTTLARILSKALNCTEPKDGEPCNTCATCTAITNGQFTEWIEIDAASRTKVEDTRDLLSNVQYAPVHGKYKIYLIDEVHMLSTHSFNALLKTLEEPPPHVIFILATTDPEKLPITVLSRCLQFHLKPLNTQTIAAQLKTVLADEKVTTNDAALTAIAHAANGSMRDALSLLDQALIGGNTTLDEDTIHQLLGSVAPVNLTALIQAIIDSNGDDAMTWINENSDRGIDFATLTDDLLQLLHHAAQLQVIPKSLPKAHQNFASASKLSEQLDAETIQLYYEIVLLNKKHLAYAASIRQGFEMLILRLLAFTPAQAETTKKKVNRQQVDSQQTGATTAET